MPLAIQEVTAPTVEPVSLDDVKAHARIDISADDDYITDLITAVRQILVQDVWWRSLVTTTWRQRFEEFPNGDGAIDLPLPPLATIVHVKYYDQDGVQQTWASANYKVDTDSEPGRVQPVYGTVWPSTRPEPGGAVEIQFTAGYGSAASNVPMRYRLGLKIAVAELYSHREEATTENVRNVNAVQRVLRALALRRFV